MSRLFISHSSKNNAEALALQGWLERHGWAKGDVFLDIDPEHGLVAGQRWVEELGRAASRCEAVICAITQDWLASSYCRVELNVAKSKGKQVFGVICRPTTFEEITSKLPELSAEYQIVDLSTEGDKEEIEVAVPPDGHVETVRFRHDGLVRLRTGLVKAGIDARTFAFDPKRPIFPGLRALEEQDASILFGRDGKIVESLDALRKAVHQDRSLVFAIIGASGSGKSSFLRAGLYPRIERDDRHWLPAPVIRPLNEILSNREGLYAALERCFAALGRKRAQGDLRSEAGTPNGFIAIIDELRRLAHERLLDEEAPLPTVVLSIDQGEELFDPQQREAAAFVDLVSSVQRRAAEELQQAVEGKDAAALKRLRDQPPRLVVLLTIRSDNFENLQKNEILSPQQGAIFSLPPMPKAAFKDVIEGPVRRLNEKAETPLELEQPLVDRLLEDVGGESSDALPLLAFVLENLFTQYQASRKLTLKQYEDTGRLQGAILAAVKKAFDTDDPAIPREESARNDLLRRAFIPWLARVDDVSREVKRNVARWEDIPADTRPLIERLIQVRLLRSYQPTDQFGNLDLTQSRTIEPAHEALLRQWPTLVAWLNEEHANLLTLETLLKAAKDWQDHGRSGDWLTHRTGRLLDAEVLSQRLDYAKKIVGIPSDYLAAARQTEDAQRQAEREQIEREKKLLRRALLGATVAVVAVSVGLYLTFSYAERAEENLANALTSQSRFLADQARQALAANDRERAIAVITEAFGVVAEGVPPDETLYQAASAFNRTPCSLAAFH